MRIAVIGSGVSGIAAAKTLKQVGHSVVVFERTPRIGGVWAVAYTGVHLQNMAELYAFTDFPWPFAHDPFPAAAEILRYLEAAVAHYDLEVRLSTEVVSLERQGEGWSVTLASAAGPKAEAFDAVVVAAGHYTHEKTEVTLPGRGHFAGRIATEHEIADGHELQGKRVAVVGFGKSAVDMVSLALRHAREVHHVFREARWLLPRKMFGQPTSRISTSRMSAAQDPCWVHPDPKLAEWHRKNPKGVAQSAAVVSGFIRLHEGLRGFRWGKARERLRRVDPAYPVTRQLRGTLAPDGYFAAVARGAVEPHASALKGFSETALLLQDGSAVAADVVILAIGYKRPALPFLPEPVRSAFSLAEDGAQLYRHILYPGVSRLAFAGFNHNFLHIPTVEMSMLWFDAVLRGQLLLPSDEEMAASAGRVMAWKRQNTIFEPTRAYLVGAHMHNYLDVLLAEIGVSAKRKRNKTAEWMQHYTAADYATVVSEYRQAQGPVREALPLDT